ncbi:MAG: hypothetical protein HY434_01110 [Candidatus Liptonbacteria bacterium]|nr:hypothetical protein [Candidatus Liptonbacteria bacterium]
MRELEEILDKVEGLLGNVREAFLREQTMLEQRDIAKAAEESERGIRLLNDAANILAEAPKTVQRSDIDTATQGRLEGLRVTMLELGRLEMKNLRMGVRLMNAFRQGQAH